MSTIDFLRARWQGIGGRHAIIWKDEAYSYKWLSDKVSDSKAFLDTEKIEPGTVAILEGDFSPNALALLLALLEARCIIVPLTKSVRHKREEFIEIASGEVLFAIDEEDGVSTRRLNTCRSHELYEVLRQADHPGLVLFSSGTTGKSKGVVHDFVPLLEKFKPIRKAIRTVAFLLFDHIGGLNTLFYTLSNGGCLITPQARTPDAVLEAVERFQAELLPVSPTFLNLILLSQAYERHDLSSLQIVSYGTEPMSESTLKRLCALFPKIQMLQLYGLSEAGILRSKSKSSDSLWMRLEGDEFETRVVDSILEVKATTAMLGYLNAPSPFTPDGWLVTGDSVEVDGEYVRILGRKSDLINVGGEKVHPSEVESVIQEMENVAEVSVYGEKNSIMGNVICARVRLRYLTRSEDFAAQLKQFCRERLQGYKVPVRVLVVEEDLHSKRFKKTRPQNLISAGTAADAANGESFS